MRTRTLMTDADAVRQSEAAARVAAAWKCNVREYGRDAPVDWRLEVDGKTVAVAEFKTRFVEMGQYPTVFLAVSKWQAIERLAAALGVRGLYVIAYRDGMRWVDVGTLADLPVTIEGRRDRDNVPTDREPMTHVPVADMGWVR